MLDVELTPAASADLDDIFGYSIVEFGPRATDRYMANVEAVIVRLRELPESGRMYEGIQPATRCVTAGSHRIFYRCSQDRVIVLRVLHQSMDHRNRIGD